MFIQKLIYLFIDFIFNNLSFPIFKEMMKENMPVHYLTESTNIYNQFCVKLINVKPYY